MLRHSCRIRHCQPHAAGHLRQRSLRRQPSKDLQLLCLPHSWHAPKLEAAQQRSLAVQHSRLGAALQEAGQLLPRGNSGDWLGPNRWGCLLLWGGSRGHGWRGWHCGGTSSLRLLHLWRCGWQHMRYGGGSRGCAGCEWLLHWRSHGWHRWRSSSSGRLVHRLRSSSGIRHCHRH